MPQNMFWLQQLVILLMHHQFLCHGSWATGTAAGASLTPTPPAPFNATIPLVSSSEATLLTKPFLMIKSRELQHRRSKSATNVDFDAFNEIPSSSATAEEAPKDGESKQPKSRFKIVSIQTNCTRDLFEMNIELNTEFRGVLYAKDFPLECRARGTSSNNITLRLPTSGCGVRAEPRSNGSYMELSVRVMLQMAQKLRQSSDILRTVRCKLPLNAMGMTVIPSHKTHKQQHHVRNGRMRSLLKQSQEVKEENGRKSATDSKELLEDSSSDDTIKESTEEANAELEATTETPEISIASASATGSIGGNSTPRVRIWLELGGPDGSGAVEVGQATTLTVRAIVPGTMGVRVVDCAALDGLGESMQQLLDERGCPIDEQVMPALHTHFKPVEEGWSRMNEDDLMEKTFTATFPAFKFPDRERLHVSCGVQLCKGKCPNINCRTDDKLILANDKHLARIEVFNSLAVTAPQIEVDRLRYDRYYNNSEEYPPNVRPLPSEGTLCLSVSKLALSFCILGLIFLIAIVVALWSLIRSRRRTTRHSCGTLTSNSNRLHMRAEVCTSMFSSSSESAQSARLGSKLLQMPHYPNTSFPYGRVY